MLVVSSVPTELLGFAPSRIQSEILIQRFACCSDGYQSANGKDNNMVRHLRNKVNLGRKVHLPVPKNRDDQQGNLLGLIGMQAPEV